jgi:hypothetical protein
MVVQVANATMRNDVVSREDLRVAEKNTTLRSLRALLA